MSAPRFRRVSPAVEATGCRQYSVLVDGEEIGTVSNRRGDYWSATSVTGVTSSRFCRTRAEAVKAILPNA